MATFYYMDTSNMGLIESVRHIHHNFELYGVSFRQNENKTEDI